MPEKKLDLLQLAARGVAEPSARPPQIVRREFRNAERDRVFFHDVPDCLFGDAGSPDLSSPGDTAKQGAVDYTGCCQPVVNCLLHPVRHRHGPDMAAFSHHVNDGPVILALLQVSDLQFSQFATAQATAEEDRQDRSVTLSDHGVLSRQAQQGLSFSGCKPIAKPGAELLGTPDALNACRELRAEQTRICG